MFMGCRRWNGMRRVVVFDLDGTLVDCNTFHVWVAFATVCLTIRGAWLRAGRIILASVRRLAGRRISHQDWKRTVVSESQLLPRSWIRVFAKLVLYRRNRAVFPALARALDDDDCMVVLATAAPAVYVNELAPVLGIEHWTASYEGASGWVENVSTNKFDSVMQLLGPEPNTIDELYTDHHDDLPLMKCAKEVFLVKPGTQTREIIEGTVQYTIMN